MNIDLDYRNLSVFHGRTSQSIARIYVRAEGGDADDRLTLSGTVRGPYCRFSQTLPTTVPLADLGPGASLLAEAVLLDPCFWSPATPALYKANIDIVSNGEVVSSAEREFGIRMFGAAGDCFRMDGRRIVIRGITAEDLEGDQFEYLRESMTTLFVKCPDDRLCLEASEAGAMLAAWLATDARDVELQLRRLSQFAAVAMVVVDCRMPEDWRPRNIAPNVTVLQYICTENETEPTPWADAVLVKAELMKAVLECTRSKLPVVALRRHSDNRSPLELRSECDRLQRDLTAIGDFAGYVV